MYIFIFKNSFFHLSLVLISLLIDNLTYIDNMRLGFMEDSQEQKYELTLNYKTTPFDYQYEDIK